MAQLALTVGGLALGAFFAPAGIAFGATSWATIGGSLGAIAGSSIGNPLYVTRTEVEAKRKSSDEHQLGWTQS